jgi:hypothetical protein
MNKKVIAYIIIVIVFLGVISLFTYKKFYNPVSKQVAYTTSAEYTASIDYSCKKSSDCEIKDVHNCCGEYRQCVNKKAKTDPDFITKACAKEGIGSICGAPVINQCDCVDKKCVGVQK